MSAASALHDSLKLGASGLNLATSVACLLQFLVRVGLFEVVIPGKDRSSLAAIKCFLE